MPKNIFFSWEAPEFRHYPKTTIWYIVFGLLIGGLIFYQVNNKDWFGTVCVSVIAILLYIFAHQKPKMVNANISNEGIHFGELHFPYKHIKHFWVVDTEHHTTLNLQTHSTVHDVLIIELEDQDPTEIREFLIQVLPEHNLPYPTVTQRLMHRLKF